MHKDSNQKYEKFDINPEAPVRGNSSDEAESLGHILKG